MINIIGSFFDTSGYSVHCRELANALNELTPVKLITGLPNGWEKQVNDKELEMIKRPDFDINLIITMPMYWGINCSAKRNWVYLVWEGNKIPKSFIKECENPNIEYIFVPSQHTKDAILNTAKENTTYDDKSIKEEWLSKIKIISHGVDLKKFYPGNKPRVDNLNNENVVPFTFIANKGFRNMWDRGGIQFLIQAYIEEFNHDEKVNLLLKINPAYGIPDMNAAISIIAKKTGKDKFPPINVNTTAYEYKELVKLYQQGDVFVSPTRAEAFNLGCIEAMACGLPVITSTFGGQTDFVNKENGWLIGGELVDVKNDIMYEGIKWLNPNIDELRKAMREAFNIDLKEKKELSLKTAKEYTWEATSKNIYSLL